MVKITFPHMGNMSIAAKAMFKELGFNIIEPLPITSKTFELGTKYSPEFACLPLKLNLGNFIEALENGADTIVMGGGSGPCRFGYYCQVQREILNKLAYSFEMIVLEPPQNFRELKSKIKILKNTNSWADIYRALRLTLKKIDVLDEIDKKTSAVRPSAQNVKLLDKTYEKILNKIDDAASIYKLENTLKNGLVELSDHLCEKRDDYETVKIALIGEIYMMLETRANMELERYLGNLGAEVRRNVYLGNWIREHLNPLPTRKKNPAKTAAKKYLDHFVGGHGWESVGDTVLSAEGGYDGVLHILPFTCAPELIAQNLFPRISKELKIPIVSISLDEHTGRKGLETRLEAFYDMLKMKKISLIFRA